MAVEKPEYIQDLEFLKSSGSFDRLQKMMDEQTDVWILRSSGEWQKGKLREAGHAGLSVTVAFTDSDGKSKQKLIKTKEFLDWQEQAPKE